MKTLKRSWPVAILATLLLLSCNHYKAAITTVLYQDSLNTASGKDNDSLIAVGMRHIDLSECPSDFAVAYVDHLHAWEHAADVQDALAYLRSDDVRQRAFGISLFQKIFGADHTVSDDLAEKKRALKDEEKNADNQVNETFNEVERIAVQYGARLH